MKLTHLILISAACASICTGCGYKNSHNGDPTTDKLSVAVSVEPQRYILNQLLDSSQVAISTLITPGANPETYELTPRKRMDLEHSDIYLSTGVLPFEEAITSTLSVPVADSSRGITFVYGSHGESCGHSHGAGAHHHDSAPDPHIWTSVENVRIMASNMATAIAHIRPEMQATLQERLNTFNLRLDSIDSSIRRRLADADSCFIIWHPSLSYFARDYDLGQIAVGFESKEMPAGRLRQIIDHAAASKASVFFFQQEFDSRQAKGVNDMLGSHLVVINPLSSDWEGQIDIITDALTQSQK